MKGRELVWVEMTGGELSVCKLRTSLYYAYILRTTKIWSCVLRKIKQKKIWCFIIFLNV